MNNFTVSFFGHRKIEDLQQLDECLTPMIKKLIQTKPYVTFLIGRNGEFDEYAASVIKRAQRELGKENNELTLVLPYTVANLPYYERYYDYITIPESVDCAHPKSAITLKNRWMIDQSDLVIFFVKNDVGGAHTAMKYAKKSSKHMINLANII